MEKKKKVIVGVIIVLAVSAVLGVVLLLTQNDNAKELLNNAGETTESEKDSKEDEKDSKDDTDKAENPKDGNESGAGGNGFVDNGGTSVSGTSASQSGDIKMSSLCTFKDPSNISFDKRYVLHGDSSCIPAKAISNTYKINCKEAYVVLYAKNGKAMGEYKCYVMNSESDAQELVSKASAYFNSSDMSCGRWGDVVYIYSTGNYVQTSIDIYYNQGTIKSATPEAYLGMAFLFGGMSEYKSSSGSTGNESAGSGSGATAPNPTPSPTPGPTPTPDPTPDDSSEKSIEVTADKLTADITEAKTAKDSSFDIPITNKYTLTDPEGLDYDERYVLYGASGCGAVVAAGQTGVEAVGAYEVYYIKDGQLVAAYRYLDTKDDENAAKANTSYAGMGTATAVGKVACLNMDIGILRQMMDMLAQFGMCADATPEAYMQYLSTYENYKFYKSENPTVEEEKSVPVASDKLTGNIAEAKTTKTNSFDIMITNKYTLTDPQGLEYDERYVLYGGITCGAVITAGQMGVEAVGAYEVYYIKDGQLVAAYRYLDAKDNENAEMANAIFAGMGTVTIVGKVACVNMDTGILQQMIEMLVQFGMCADATPEAYMQYLSSSENYKFYKNPNPMGEPGPTPDVTEGLKGTTPSEAFSIKFSDSFTYDESQVLPPTFTYDTRYVLFGDSKCGYAMQYGATGFYEILYCLGDSAIMEIKGYVMADADAASALASQFLGNGMYAMAVPNTNVVLVLDSGVQNTIENLVVAGWITEALPKAYLEELFIAAGMKECAKA